jgi:hypothetical protein
MSSSDLIRLVEKDGWVIKSVNGSHHHFKHPTKKGKVTIPHPRKDLPIGTVNAILKQAGLK